MKTIAQIKVDLARARFLPQESDYMSTLKEMISSDIEQLTPYLFDKDPNVREAAKILITEIQKQTKQY